MLPNPFLDQQIAQTIHAIQQFFTTLSAILSVAGPIVFTLLWPKIKQRIQDVNVKNAQKAVNGGGETAANPFMTEWGVQLGRRVDTLEGSIKERFDLERRLTREGFDNVRDVQDRQSTRIADVESLTRKHGDRLTELEKPKL